MATMRQLREASSVGGSIDAGGADALWKPPFVALHARRGGTACRGCGQQENRQLALLCDLIAVGIEKAGSSTSLFARIRRNQSPRLYLTATSCLGIQIPFKIPKQM